MLNLIPIAIWLVGAWLRIYQQAQFYQIEEYMSRRYLRWLLADRARALATRPLLAWLLGIVLSVLLNEGTAVQRPYLVLSIAAIIAILPPSRRETKKPLVLTSRVTRLLFSSG